MSSHPEIHIDIHGLAGGSMNDRIWLEGVLPFVANDFFAVQMAISNNKTLRQSNIGTGGAN